MNPIFTPCRYLLQWTSPDAKAEPRVVVVPTVGSIQAEQGPATVVRFPADPFADAYIEHAPLRHEPIVLSGTSGLEARQGSTRTGGLAIMSGPELFEELRDFLADYTNDAAKRANATTRRAEPILTLYATWENLAWVIGKHRLTWRHTVADGTLTYQWSLRLEAVGRADDAQDVFDPLDGREQQPIENAELAGLARGGMGVAYYTVATGARQWIPASVIGDAAKSIRAGKSIPMSGRYLPDGIPGPLSEDAVVFPDFASDAAVVELFAIGQSIGAVGTKIKRSIEDVQRALTRVANVRRAAEQVFDFPASIFSSTLGCIERGLIEVDAAMDDVTFQPDSAFARSLRRYDAALCRLKRSVERAFATAGQTRVPAAGDAPGGPTVVDRVVVRGDETCVTRVINGSETLPSFALRVLGSRDLWRAVQRLNRIVDPWRTGLGVPIGTGGFALLVPDDGGPKVPRDGTTNVFGQNWLLDDAGQLVWHLNAGFEVVTGLPCYAQRLTMVFRHKKNTLAADPECGMLDVIGEILFPTDLARILADMRSQALRDSCTSAVERLLLVQENDTVLLAADIRPADGETQRVTVPVTIGAA